MYDAEARLENESENSEKIASLAFGKALGSKPQPFKYELVCVKGAKAIESCTVYRVPSQQINIFKWSNGLIDGCTTPVLAKQSPHQQFQLAEGSSCSFEQGC